MPLGKQAAPGIFSFLFPDGCGKAQDAHPRPFSFFFPSGFICGFCFYKHCSHLFSSVGAFVFPIPCGIGGKDGATPLQKCIGA